MAKHATDPISLLESSGQDQPLSSNPILKKISMCILTVLHYAEGVQMNPLKSLFFFFYWLNIYKAIDPSKIKILNPLT